MRIKHYSMFQMTLRRTGKLIQGVAGLVNAVKGLDLNGFMDGLKDIQQGMAEWQPKSYLRVLQ